MSIQEAVLKFVTYMMMAQRTHPWIKSALIANVLHHLAVRWNTSTAAYPREGDTLRSLLTHHDFNHQMEQLTAHQQPDDRPKRMLIESMLRFIVTEISMFDEHLRLYAKNGMFDEKDQQSWTRYVSSSLMTWKSLSTQISLGVVNASNVVSEKEKIFSEYYNDLDWFGLTDTSDLTKRYEKWLCKS